MRLVYARKKMMKSLILVSLLFTQIYFASACICFNPPISEVLKKTDAIFIGKVIGFDISYSIELDERLFLTEFEVLNYYDGDLKFGRLPKFVIVAQTYTLNDCGLKNLEIGKEYLLYTPFYQGFLWTAACGVRVLRTESHDFQQDLDSLKILGFYSITQGSNDTLSLSKEKQRYIQEKLDSLKNNHTKEIKQLIQTQSIRDRNRIYIELIALFLILLIFFRLKFKK